MGFEVEIVKYAPPGNGLGYYKGKAVFVPAAAVGDVVRVFTLKEKKRFIIAGIETVVSPSAERIEAACPHYNVCGGCSLMHLPYKKQIDLKQQMMADVFNGASLQINPDILPCQRDQQFRYRSQLKCSNGFVGYSEKHRHHVFEVTECLILAQGIQKTLPVLKRLGRMHCEFRLLESSLNGDVSLTVSENGLSNPVPGFPQLIKEDYGFGEIELNSDSFSQSNPLTTRSIIEDLLAASEDCESACELYCGSGTFSIPLAKKMNRLVGFDVDPKAIETAKKNAERHDLNHATFNKANLEKNVEIPSVDMILVDPPRKGLSQTALSKIGRSGASKLLYVSCDPATLARDASILIKDYRFNIDFIRGYDMYCHSTHLEALATFIR